MAQIHDTRITLLPNSDGAKAFAKVEVGLTDGGTLVLGGIKVMEGRQGGLWVAWPGKRNESTGKFYADLYFPNQDDKQEIEQAIITAYEAEWGARNDRMAHRRPAAPSYEPPTYADDDLPF